MLYYPASALINFITSISLCLLIFIRNPRNKINYSYSLYAFGVGFWSLCYFFWQISSNAADALFWSKALMAFAIFIPAFYSHFVFVFTGLTKRKITLLIFAYILLGSFLPFNIFGSLFIQGIKPLLGFKFWPIAGPLFSIFLIIWMGYVIFDTYLLYIAYKKATGIYKNQIKYIFLGLSLAFLGGVTNYFLWYEIPIPPIGNILVSLYVALTAYAIIRHRLFDIRLVIARSVAYLILIAIIAIFYTSSVFILGNFFFTKDVDSNQLLLYGILTIFVAFTFQPLKHFLEDVTDRIFFKSNYNSNVLLSTLTKILATNLRLEDLSAKTLNELCIVMHVSRGAFYAIHGEKITRLAGVNMEKESEDTEKEILTLCKNKKIIIFEEEENEKDKEIMRKIKASVILPLYVEEKLNGALLLGEKKSGDIYFGKDIEVLRIFGPEVSVALENANSYEEIRKFNITLKEEVDHATKDLQNANVRLKQVDKLKDEFVSLASHELRTPMTVIKSYLWLMLDKKNSESLSEVQKKYLDRAYVSTERLIHLVNDMLNISRIESGRFSVSMMSLDLEGVVNNVYAEMLTKAQEQKINLEFARPLHPSPKVNADPERIEQVLINLIGNSLKFTQEGGSIRISIEHDENSKEEIVSVTDNGKGIAAEDISKLFQKFSMVGSNYLVKQNVQGTGLGLYLSKAMIQMMGGKIWAESEGLGKGAKFSFTLKTV